MKDAEDEAFDELAKRQGAWGGGYQTKRAMAADKLQGPEREALQMCLEYIETNAHERKHVRHAIQAALTQPAQESEILTIVYQSGYHDGKQAALAGREWNFCERCGKRTADLTVIHTCTPPQEKNNA
jgi:hypothetical protein